MANSSQTKIAFFGECMIELSGDPIHKGFGGDTLNTALYLSRLTASYPGAIIPNEAMIHLIR